MGTHVESVGLWNLQVIVAYEKAVDDARKAAARGGPSQEELAGYGRPTFLQPSFLPKTCKYSSHRREGLTV